MRPKRDRGPAPPEKRCRATTRGMKVRGAYWSPPHRCGDYAVFQGYCRLHRPPDGPPEPPADDAPRSGATAP